MKDDFAQVWHELRNILMVMILLMLYLVLWVPYIVMAKGDQVAAKYKKILPVLTLH